MNKVYHLYFGCKVEDLDKNVAPHVRRNVCATNLRHWLNGKGAVFRQPMIWKDPTNYSNNCYFCVTSSIGKSLLEKKKE